MSKVTMYASRTCPYCDAAEELLRQKGVEVEKIMVDTDPGLKAKMMEITGRRTVPQIFIGKRHVGGYDDLAKLSAQGLLTDLLQQEGVAHGQ